MAQNLPDWLALFTVGELDLQMKPHGELQLPSGRIVACDPLAFLRGAAHFTRSVPPGSYPIELAIDGGEVAFAVVHFTNEAPMSWEVAQFAERQGDDSVAYPVETGTGCFVDADIAAALGEVQNLHLQEGAAWIRTQEIDPNNASAWHAAFDRFEAEHPPPLAEVTAGTIVEIPEVGGNLVTFSSGAGNGAFRSYFGLNQKGYAVCLVSDFGLLEPDQELEETPPGAVDVLAGLGGLDDFDDDLDDEPIDESPWVLLARLALVQWVESESVELEDEANTELLIDKLADVLASEPTPDKLEDWLIRNRAVAEVYVDGESLLEQVKKRLKAAKN